MNYLPCVEVEPVTEARSSVIWLHGLGADGHDFESMATELKMPPALATRFIFPHSPSIPVTVNGGKVMPAWYDILEVSFERKINLEHLTSSSDAIHALINREVERGVTPNRIVLAGFSQGGAVAYQAALTYNKPLAGLLAMSTYYATKNVIAMTEANQQLDISIMHGSLDSVVPARLGEQALQTLTNMGFNPSFKLYPMQHTVCMAQVKDIADWLKGRFSC